MEAAALGKAPPTLAIQPTTSRRFLSTGLSGVPLLLLPPNVSLWSSGGPVCLPTRGAKLAYCHLQVTT